MRIFFDTEFIGFRDSKLLSIGFVSEDSRECYAELPAEGSHLTTAGDFVLTKVVGQFGRVPGASVPDLARMGTRVRTYLGSFSGMLVLCYDFKWDWRHLESLIDTDHELLGRIRAEDIAGTLSGESGIRAAVRSVSANDSRIGEHHALADARALRAAWLARASSGDADFAAES